MRECLTRASAGCAPFAVLGTGYRDRRGDGGAQSFTAIGEWIADAPLPVLACLGIRRDPLIRRFEPPGEATIGRILEAVDAAVLDTEVSAWLSARVQAARPPAGPRPGRRAALAVDGKALQGTHHAPTAKTTPRSTPATGPRP